MTKATDLIAAERERQITEEGYTAEHDREHAGELTSAAECYAAEARYQIGHGSGAMDFNWPWADEHWKPTGDPVKDLVKAGSLIAAAIDSLLARKEESCPRATGATLRRAIQTSP